MPCIKEKDNFIVRLRSVSLEGNGWSRSSKREGTSSYGFFSFVMFLLCVLVPLGSVWASEFTSEKVIQLVNESRLSHKEDILVRNDLLTKAAQMKADDMFSNNYFAHTSPEGKTPWVWFKNVGYDYEYAGENLAIHFTNPETQHQAWMKSITHRKNILNPEYREIGVAVRRGVLEGHDTIVTVQEFGRRVDVMPSSQQKTIQNAPLVEEVSFAKTPPLVYSQMDISRDSVYNRLYGQVFIFFWGIVATQVLVLGYMAFRGARELVMKGVKGEYKIPVRVIQ